MPFFSSLLNSLRFWTRTHDVLLSTHLYVSTCCEPDVGRASSGRYTLVPWRPRHTDPANHSKCCEGKEQVHGKGPSFIFEWCRGREISEDRTFKHEL